MSTKHLKGILAARKRKVLKKIQHKARTPRPRPTKFKRARHSKKPVYLSSKMTEYMIEQDADALFKIKRYKGGKLAKDLQGRWTNYSDCETALIQWLEKHDKMGWSRYPGCKNKRTTEYMRVHFGEDF